MQCEFGYERCCFESNKIHFYIIVAHYGTSIKMPMLEIFIDLCVFVINFICSFFIYNSLKNFIDTGV